MKKILLTKVFSILSAAFLLAGTLHSNLAVASVDDDGGKTTVTCPEGDTYKCYTQGTLTVYKGKGEVIITPSN